MSETFDPTALLSKPVSSVKAPVKMPVGSYLGVASKFAFDKAKNEQQTPLVRFVVNPTEALPDVDQDALRESLTDGDGNVQPLTSKEQRLEFWLTPDAMFRLTDFGKDHVQVENADSMTIGELINEIVGKPFMFTLVQAPNKKEPANPYINIGSTGPVPA